LTGVDAAVAQIQADLKRVATDAAFAGELMAPKEGNPVSLGSRVPSGEEMAANMVAGAQANQQKWLERTMHPRKDPIAGMKGANATYKARTQEAIAQDRYAKGVANIDETEMYATIQKRGGQAFASGVADRQGKITKKMIALAPKIAAVATAIDRMANVTDADREARMLANVRGMRAIKGTV
jgi:hypothetical protein